MGRMKFVKPFTSSGKEEYLSCLKLKHIISYEYANMNILTSPLSNATLTLQQNPT